ncbi:hypothetical protein VIGAN_08110800 [Vigna angularis var. angularis]|uniref:Uncharacterized protein n=1 Tax=Vigna angularis var. angularis TaxID=157739 RepID=A0A0S3SNY4_PHAAN|nr:hypothetical protein VIGAN_08110800 [Vigna angularis var. angularis]
MLKKLATIPGDSHAIVCIQAGSDSRYVCFNIVQFLAQYCAYVKLLASWYFFLQPIQLVNIGSVTDYFTITSLMSSSSLK